MLRALICRFKEWIEKQRQPPQRRSEADHVRLNNNYMQIHFMHFVQFIKRNGWKITWVALGVTAFIGTLSFLNEVLVEAPAREARAERLAEEMREIRREADYNQCLDAAYDAYTLNWNSKCKLLGKEADCSMLPIQGQVANDAYAADQKRCDLRYGK